MINILIFASVAATLAFNVSSNINTINNIDTAETKYSSIPTPYDQNFGTATYVDTSNKSYNSTGKKTTAGKAVYSSITYYKLYKYNKVASSILISLEDSFHSFNKGSSYTVSSSVSSSDTLTYSKQVSDTVTNIESDKVAISAGYSSTKAEASKTVTSEFSSSVTKSIANTYTKVEENGNNITYSIDETGTYRLIRRAHFNVYILQYVTEVYSVTNVLNGKYQTSKFAYYTIDTSYILSYISGTLVEGLYKYNSSNGIYKLDIDYAKKYNSDSSVVYID